MQKEVSLICNIFENLTPNLGGVVAGEEGNSDVMVYVDRHKLSQVLHNLLSNAIKFTPPKGNVTVVATVEQGCPIYEGNGHRLSATGERTVIHGSESAVLGTLVESTVGYVKVTVTDTGVGLSQVRRDCDRAYGG